MNEKTYSRSVVNAINNFLTDDGWRFSFDDRNGVFRFGLNLNGRLKKINYIVNVRENYYTVYAVSPIGADEDDKKMMATMAEFICRVNYGLINGNFELDINDGEIRFKCFLPFEDITPTMEMIKSSIYCPAVMFNRYSAGIVDIIFGNSTAKKAIAKCEGTTAEELQDSLEDDMDDEELQDSLEDDMDDEEFQELMEDETDDEDDISEMFARLASKLGVDVSSLHSEHPDSDEDTTDIKTDLFKGKGGAA